MLKKNGKKWVCVLAAVCLLGLALFCGAYLYGHYSRQKEQTEAFHEIAERVRQIRENGEEKGEASPPPFPGGTGAAILPEYEELFWQNPDMVGWIRIEGTTMDYPVVQNPDDPDYYLEHNFDREYSKLGTPCLQEDCDVTGGDNLIIYGHHIKGGKMFGALMGYRKQGFYEEHPIIRFDTLTRYGEYEIIAVFKTVAYRADSFRYYDFVRAEDKEAFDAYVKKCKELSLYDTGVTAEYGDRLLILSTCEFSAKDGRLVVVAKEIERQDEAEREGGAYGGYQDKEEKERHNQSD